MLNVRPVKLPKYSLQIADTPRMPEVCRGWGCRLGWIVDAELSGAGRAAAFDGDDVSRAFGEWGVGLLSTRSRIQMVRSCSGVHGEACGDLGEDAELDSR